MSIYSLLVQAELGRALVEAFVAKPNTTVIATTRDQDQDTSHSLPCGESSKLVTVKIDSASEDDAAKAAASPRSDYGIERLDVIVANAGFGNVYGDLSQVQPNEVQDLVDINALGDTLIHVVGPLRLLQAFRSLLENGTNPRFVLIGTPIASITAMDNIPFPMVAYGAIKTVAYYLIRKLYCESPVITSFVVDPGFMQTDMGNTGARHFGYEQAFILVNAACDFVVRQIETATKEKVSGKFLTIDETQDYIA